MTQPDTLAPRRVRRLPLIAILLGLVLVLTACTPAQQAVFDHMNANRHNAGEPSYLPHANAIAKAQDWANSLAQRGVLEHSNLADGMPPGWQMLGENVGRGPTLLSVLEQFLVSPAHRANLLNPDFNWAGMGVATASDGQVYVVEEFARY